MVRGAAGRDVTPGHRPLWTCPSCGHSFITRNMWHSCSAHTLDEHFVGRPAELRAVWDRCVDLLAEVGPLVVIPQKTRIVVMVRVRFAGAVVKRRWIDVSVALRREVTHPLLHTVTWYTPRWAGHTFRLVAPEQVDEQIAGWLRESYAVGAQSG